MSGPLKTVERLSDREITEVVTARAAARARFAQIAEDAGEISVVFDPDNPPMTDADLARLRPAAEMVPALVAASLRRQGRRPQPAQPAAEPSIGTAAGDVIQIVEERLEVGKRSVSRGRVRVHSSVIEKAVSENITLHGETLTVDRHAADRPVALGAIDPFKERVIEMEEIDEEAVVAKSARVVEEINLRKDAADRVETVRDAVRSTKIEIDDARTVATASLATTQYETLIRDDMDIIGSDGAHVGTVDHLDGARIKLKKNDFDAGGQHHFIPLDWIKSIADEITLSITADEVEARWPRA